MALKAEIDGDKLIITIDMQKPEKSASGKTLAVRLHARQRADRRGGEGQAGHDRAQRLHQGVGGAG